MIQTKPISASTKGELVKRLLQFTDEIPIFVYDGWGVKRPAFISFAADEEDAYLIIGVEPNKEAK